MIRPNRALKLLSLATLTAILAAGAPASAAVPQTIAFQGFLADTSGQPLDGTFVLKFSVYDAATGGNLLWAETHPAVTIDDGVFGVSLGSQTPFTPAVALTGPRFLGTAVNGEPELPRVALQSAPFALRAATADTVSEALLLWDGGLSTVETYKDTSGWRSLRMFSNPSNPFDAIEYMFLGPDPIVGAGSLELRGEGSPAAFARLHGDWFGGGSLILSSPDAFIDLSADPNTGVGNDFTVRVPVGAINAAELLSEPGLAAASNTGFVALTSTLSSALSRTITPPADGYVLALGQCVARINHTNGTATNGVVGLSEDGVNLGVAQDVNLQIPSGAAAGSYSLPAHHNVVFAATALTPLTIHLMGREDSGVIDLEDLSLTLLYVPTTYGTVTKALLATGDGEDTLARAPQSPAEIAAERDESQRNDIERLERELATMRAEHAARLTELETRLEKAGDRR